LVRGQLNIDLPHVVRLSGGGGNKQESRYKCY